ncbi:MAG: hypothetical protein AAGE52_18685, partial [Myxococcota bacterium]
MRALSTFAILFALACGGSDGAETTAEETTETTSGNEQHQSEEDDGVAIEGLMGTISALAVERGLEPRMQRFLRCFS